MRFEDGTAVLWDEELIIPTYPVGEPDHNPMFLEKRVYQGSSGDVYPFAVIDRVSDQKIDKTYRAVFLENDYLRIMVLPELGGRIQMAYAKHLDYHFIYYNKVIKPALVGLAGPWISGGIEFNWPQHHRPSTFTPVDYLMVNNPDGSVTLWLGEIDRMHRTRGLAGLTLHPRRAYLQVEGRLFNRTALPQSFLWWANAAVSVNDQYQSVFPPDVRAVLDHGRRDVSRFPIATGTYYKVDYSAGVDISWYRNIPVPTSYMAYHSDYDFLGGYDHGRRAGILHVADHHVSPGKKQWTWGSGEFGRSWDRNLTDEDGPYIELMAGVFTDNQPDFSWLEPGEEKRFTQFFLPYAAIGPVKNASRDAAIAMDIADGQVVVGVYSTAHRIYRVICEKPGAVALDQTVTIAPELPYSARFPLPPGATIDEMTLSISSTDGEMSLAYHAAEKPARPVPEPAKPALPPAEIRSQEELYLLGLHLEQYRHATFHPEDYYAEALRRDPGDARCNCAMGLLFLRRGGFAQSEGYFRRAVQRLTWRNANPYDGEPLLFLGYALELQGKDDEARDAYHKAAWNGRHRGAACAGLARLALKHRDHAQALAHAEESLAANPRSQTARMLRVMTLRKLGRTDEALAEIQTALDDDPLNFTAMNERILLGAASDEARTRGLMGNRVDRSLELALEYAHNGLYEEATQALEAMLDRDPGPVSPLVHYCLGYFAECLGLREQAVIRIRQADAAPPGTCFPNQLEAIPILMKAGMLCPEGARSFYYLGNLYYHYRVTDKAVAAWERSESIDGRFPTVRRNLALAAFNKLGNPDRALRELEAAFLLDPSDARLLLELDQLRKRLGAQPEDRLALLRKHQGLVDRRDDLFLELIGLLNLRGDNALALQLLLGRKFHPWEGGEGKVTRQYVTSLLGLSKCAYMKGEYSMAASHADRALSYPESLGEGKLFGARENDVFYYLGCALAGQGLGERAAAAFERAARGDGEPSLSMSYNDPPADMHFFQGLAYARLGRAAEARGCFNRLVDYGEGHRDRAVSIDYFAVSLPDFLIFEDDLSRRNNVFCGYLMGLGLLGLAVAGERQDEAGVMAADVRALDARARTLLETVRPEEPSHPGARGILRDLERGWKF